MLSDVLGFVLDIDGTLAHREGEDVHAQPGAAEVLTRIRASGRPLVLFTNGSHAPPAAFAAELRAAGLDIADDEVLTPLCSVQWYLERHARTGRVLVFATDSARDYLVSSGVRLFDRETGTAEAVFVAHPKRADFAELERAARMVLSGAPLLTGSYAPAYAGASGPIFSRGAMVAAALAKATSTRPVIVGKPSRSALGAIRNRLGVGLDRVAVVGDDLRMDVALGRLGGARTILVRSGISSQVELDHVADKHRPHAVVEGVAGLLDWL